ncbi:MAG: hypothetical protein OWQ57_07400 [Sulfobacillus sp.]|nr:hypothetical protein [Sulfobacillus sp.]
MARIGRWMRRQNPYLWAAAAGVAGLIDAVAPGPALGRALGAIAAVGAVWMWVLGR